MEPHDEAVMTMARNVASIADIPWEELPYGAARGCLLDMAYAGANVSACHSADGQWAIHLERQTITCAEWAAHFCV